jgi:hypothetical protein
MCLSQVPILPAATGVLICLLVMVQPPSWVLLLVGPTEITTRKYNSSEFQESLTPALPSFCFQTALILRTFRPLVPRTIQQQVSLLYDFPFEILYEFIVEQLCSRFPRLNTTP